MSDDPAYLRAEAHKALRAFHASIVLLRHSTNDEGGVNEKLSAYDRARNTVSTNHYRLALNALDNAALHIESALLTLGDAP
jgi:hypothetical protein